MQAHILRLSPSYPSSTPALDSILNRNPTNPPSPELFRAVFPLYRLPSAAQRSLSNTLQRPSPPSENPAMAKKPPRSASAASNSAAATLPAASSPNLDKFPGPHDAIEHLFSNPPSLSPWQTPSSSRPPRKSTTTTPVANGTAKMADPFEVRMRFTNQLRQLNASVTSAQKAAQYALKNRDMAEDLHSCILEQLERVCPPPPPPPSQ